MENNVVLPIRRLVEFILRSGDINSGFTEKDRMLEGARIHRVLQKKYGNVYEDYKSEVSLKMDFPYEETTYTLEGRADGIFHENGQTVVDEIKTTVLPLNLINEDFNLTHWAQAQCYAFIVAVQNELTEISIQLTYYNLDTEERKQFKKTLVLDDLQNFITNLIEKYAVWARYTENWSKLRNRTIKALAFPFPAYRKGQREFAVSVYRTIAGGKKLFAQAPTGTGKTISTLFPAVKAIGEGKTSKIFYLTAKTITRQAAEEAFEKMRRNGLRIKTLTLTAKEKICFCEKPLCNPDHCSYAKGHFDRVNDAIFDALENCDNFTRNTVEEYAKKHRVCPFELSLDISLWADCVICDYNYVFDPRAYLRRFFTEQSDSVFLIDEAHNLVDRSREMFSSRLLKTGFYAIRKQYKGRDKALDRTLNGINKTMIEYRGECGQQGYQISKEQPKKLLNLVSKYVAVCETMIRENRSLAEENDFLQLYFEALNFLLISDFYDERYVTFVEAQGGEIAVKLLCVDPSCLLAEAMKRGGSAVLFSATLTPLSYFREILGGGEEDRFLALNSPFDRGKLCLMAVDSISTRYRFREQSIDKISRLIAAFLSRKTGNYIVYFPSYKYMNDVFEAFSTDFPEINSIEQQASMTEQEKEQFLENFKENPEKTFVAFCVLGGIFSEGIDLKGSRLIGSAVVGVGLPQLSVQQNILRDYFEKKNGMGYEFAYMYPGMNKVLQAAGRVIRCESDTGAVLLIDERFGHYDYKKLFPKHWQDCRYVRSETGLIKILDDFWSRV